MTVVGESFVTNYAKIGSNVQNRRRRVSLQVRLIYKRPLEADESLHLSQSVSTSHGGGPRSNCHFWKANGSCRKGYSCPWLHDGVEPAVLLEEHDRVITDHHDANVAQQIQEQALLPNPKTSESHAEPVAQAGIPPAPPSPKFPLNVLNIVHQWTKK